MFRNVSKNSYRLQAVRITVSIFIIVLVLGLLTGCQSVAPVVKVGLVAPFEGRHRDIGYDVLYSARLAVRQVNANGGIGGTRIALVALDDGGNPEFARAVAESLLIDPKVVGVVGHWLPGTTEAAAPVYNEDLAFLAGGIEPFLAADPDTLSTDFIAAYEQVTPFDEMPGPYAGSAYDAFQTLFQALATAQEMSGQITRQDVQLGLTSIE